MKDHKAKRLRQAIITSVVFIILYIVLVIIGALLLAFISEVFRIW